MAAPIGSAERLCGGVWLEEWKTGRMEDWGPVSSPGRFPRVFGREALCAAAAVRRSPTMPLF